MSKTYRREKQVSDSSKQKKEYKKSTKINIQHLNRYIEDAEKDYKSTR
jgi:CRISPR/Cas system CSM-associated protein Csm4 (group 5 of RAMP superfamily)